MNSMIFTNSLIKWVHLSVESCHKWIHFDNKFIHIWIHLKNESRILRKFGLNSPCLWIRVNTHPIFDWTIHWFNWRSCHCIKRLVLRKWKARYGSFLIIVHWNFSIALIHCALNSSEHFWEDNISVKMAFDLSYWDLVRYTQAWSWKIP